MFKVYQPRLTNSEVNEVNDFGHNAHNAYFDLMFLRGENVEEKILAAKDYFYFTAVVNVDDLDDVFQVTNIGPEELIERQSVPMRSGSVGDVYVNEAGEAFVCVSVGFEKLSAEAAKTLMNSAFEVALDDF